MSRGWMGSVRKGMSRERERLHALKLEAALTFGGRGYEKEPRGNSV